MIYAIDDWVISRVFRPALYRLEQRADISPIQVGAWLLRFEGGGILVYLIFEWLYIKPFPLSDVLLLAIFTYLVVSWVRVAERLERERRKGTVGPLFRISQAFFVAFAVCAEVVVFASGRSSDRVVARHLYELVVSVGITGLYCIASGDQPPSRTVSENSWERAAA